MRERERGKRQGTCVINFACDRLRNTMKVHAFCRFVRARANCRRKFMYSNALRVLVDERCHLNKYFSSLSMTSKSEKSEIGQLSVLLLHTINIQYVPNLLIPCFHPLHSKNHVTSHSGYVNFSLAVKINFLKVFTSWIYFKIDWETLTLLLLDSRAHTYGRVLADLVRPSVRPFWYPS